jgi:predicted amidohydrolase
MTVRIAAAQPLEYRDDPEAALAAVVEFAHQAEAAGARLLCFPEAFLQGYLLDPDDARRVALDLDSPTFSAMLARFPASGPMIVLGLIEIEHGLLFNTAIVVEHGTLLGRYRKMHLLEREALFTAGDSVPVFGVDGLRFGINICFDTNFSQPARRVAAAGASLVVCTANNMMPREAALRYKHLHNAIRGERCRENGLWLISSDITGERDGRIAWGPTAVLDPSGAVAAQLPLEQPGFAALRSATCRRAGLAFVGHDTYMNL